MKFFYLAGAAAILAGSAFAQAAQPGHPHASGRIAQTEARADVQAHVAKMFGRLDTNRDGFVTKAEIDALDAQRAAKIEQRAQRFDPDKIFAQIDANHDGKITSAEAAAARNARAQAKGRQPAKDQATGFSGLFARADGNKDGAITRAEFDSMGAQLKNRMEKAGMRRAAAPNIFATADANKDGRLSLAEEQSLALQHFDRDDLNHDGKLTPEERKQARQQFKAQRKTG